MGLSAPLLTLSGRGVQAIRRATCYVDD